jgi:hypothetical protein
VRTLTTERPSVFRSGPREAAFADINQWWRHQCGGYASVLFSFCYAFGKAQFSGWMRARPVVHGAVDKHRFHRDAGALPPTRLTGLGLTPCVAHSRWKAPPSAVRRGWHRFGPRLMTHSGWMLRRARRRGWTRVCDVRTTLAGQSAIKGTGAGKRVITHGSVA